MEITNRTQIFFTGDKEMKTVVGYISETSMQGFTIKGLTATAYKMWWMDPETGKRTQENSLVYPKDGVLDYIPEKPFGNRKDKLVVLEAAE